MSVSEYNFNNSFIRIFKSESIPTNQICYYDIVIVLDLDCVDYNENPVVGEFVTRMVDDIFEVMIMVIKASLIPETKLNT